MLNFKLNAVNSKLLKYSLLICCVFLLIYPSNNLQAQNKKFTIVLDAGHGGKDPGNLGTHRYKKREKDIALDVTLKVGKILEKTAKDIRVIYTRKTDVYPNLWERAKIANEANADLFISIHCNSFKSSVKGTETYVLGVNRNKTNLEVAKRENDVILLEKDHEKHYQYDPNSPESIIGLTLMQEEYLDKSIELAQLIEDDFVHEAHRESRGVKQAGLIVLHQTYMPSVLVEVGFLTNKKEEDFLNTRSGQLKIAHAIVDAIKKYKLHLIRNEAEIPTVKPASFDKLNNSDNTLKNNLKIEKNNSVIFKVQIASSKNKLDTAPYNFKGLSDVDRVKVGSYYKYYFGSTNSYSEVKSLRKQAQRKGFRSAFIVAFKNGKKIDVHSVVKSL